MKTKRRKAKTIKIRNLLIGGNNPIAVQSMTKTKTADIEETVSQIKALEDAGCEIIRLAIKDRHDAWAIKKIRSKTEMPLVADIHFDWRLGLEAIDNGIDKIRLNPGNIYQKGQIKEIVAAAKQNRIPVRVGVNSGSLKSKKSILRLRSGLMVSEAEPSKAPAYWQGSHMSRAQEMARSALNYIKILEGFKFYDIVVSLKASNIFDTIEAYRRMAKYCDYPFHLGVTATGPEYMGVIKSSIAMGVLLSEGLGDTIRVSLTAQPQDEVRVARNILESLGLRNFGPQIISCPTCGRCEVDLAMLVNRLDKALSGGNSKLHTKDSRPLQLAVMGCMVNGPGEAREADIGIAFGRKEGLMFKNGKALKKVAFSNCIDTLLKETEKINA